MALATQNGLVDDNDILANERVIDMSDVISVLDPEVSQFYTMLSDIGSETAYSSKVEWMEDQLFPRLSTVNGSQTDSETGIEVAAGTGVYFRANDFVRNARSGEGFTVTSISTDTLTVVRGRGRVAAAAMSDGDQLLIVSNGSVQGGTLPTRQATKRVAQYNYTQIQRNSYGFTRTLVASKLYGGPVPDKERSKKLTEHKRALEYILFWGGRILDTSTASTPQGFAGGLFEFVTTNVKNAAGSLTKALLDTYMRDLLQHGHGSNKVLFASPVVSQAISGFLRDAWLPNDVGAKLWGAKVDGFISGAYGYKVPVVVKRDFNDFSTASTQFGGWAFLVDMDNIKLRPMNERNTMLLKDRQANDADTIDEEYLTETSVEINVEQSHGLIVGVTG